MSLLQRLQCLEGQNLRNLEVRKEEMFRFDPLQCFFWGGRVFSLYLVVSNPKFCVGRAESIH